MTNMAGTCLSMSTFTYLAICLHGQQKSDFNMINTHFRTCYLKNGTCVTVCLCGWNHTESRWMVTQDLFTGACHRQTGTNTTKSWLKDSASTLLKVSSERCETLLNIHCYKVSVNI